MLGSHPTTSVEFLPWPPSEYVGLIYPSLPKLLLAVGFYFSNSNTNTNSKSFRKINASEKLLATNVCDPDEVEEEEGRCKQDGAMAWDP